MSNLIDFNIKQRVEEPVLFRSSKPMIDNSIVFPDLSSALPSSHISLCCDRNYDDIEKICTITSSVTSG